MPPLDDRLSRALPGDLIDVSGISFSPLPKAGSTSGQLLFSNNPEAFHTLTEGGLTVLCQSIVPPGATRLFVFHVNRSGRPARLTVLLEPVFGPARLVITRRSTAPPSRDYGGIARQVQASWFRSAVRIPVTADRAVPLDPAFEQQTGADGDLFHGLWTWEADVPVQATVAAFPAEAAGGSRSLAGVRVTAPREGVFSSCPEDFRARGLFLGNRRVACTCPTNAGPAFLPVGHFFCTGSSPVLDTPTYDGWVQGLDPTPPAPGERLTLGPYLPGNYGVLYQMAIQLPGDRPAALLLNPLGGLIQGSFAASPGLTAGGITDFADFTSPASAVLMGKYSPGSSAELLLMPGGNVALPWRVLVIPFSP